MNPEIIERVQLRARKRLIDGCQLALNAPHDVFQYPEAGGDPEADERAVYAGMGYRVAIKAERTLDRINDLIQRTAARVTCEADIEDITLFAPVEWLVLLGMADQDAAVRLVASFSPAELAAMGTDTWLWTCLRSSLGQGAA